MRPSPRSDKTLDVTLSTPPLTLATHAVLSTIVPVPRNACIPAGGRFVSLPRPRTTGVLPLAVGCEKRGSQTDVPVLPLTSSRARLSSSLLGKGGGESALALALEVPLSAVPEQLNLDCKPALGVV